LEEGEEETEETAKKIKMIRVGVVLGLFLSTVYCWRSSLVKDGTGSLTSIVSDEKIPLQAVGIDGEMIDFLGKVKITQRFKNNYESNIEPKYVFDLDPKRTVVGMTMIIEERKLVSEIREKTEARQTYEQAIADHKTTGSVEKVTNGIFTVNVGNIAANEEVTIELEYITELECTDEGEMKFVLPTNIPPKYDPPQKTVTDIIANQATTNQLTYSSSASFQFDLNINWQSNSRIKQVYSLTNDIEVSGIHEKMVNIQSRTAPSKGDFNLFLQTEMVGPSLYLYKDIELGETFLMLTNRIKEEVQEIGKERNELLIVLDRSGSMDWIISGWSGGRGVPRQSKMDLAKEATELFIQSLPPNFFFNIISFGSNYEAMFSRSVPYTEENKQIALTKVTQFRADLGGTELFQCLSDVFSGKLQGPVEPFKQKENEFKAREWTPPSSSSATPPSPENKVIILITDGQVTNRDAVTNLAKQFNHKYRVFSIGIGQDIDSQLITDIAKNSNAKSQILLDNPDVTTAVVKMLDTASKHYYTSTVMKINEKEIEVNDVIYPNQFHHFFHTIPTVLFEEAVSVIELTSFDGLTGKNVSWNLPVGESITKNHSEIIRQLYAANLIKELEKTNHNNQNTAKIIELSVKYHIMNDKTSFVVVDETKREEIQGIPETVVVPQWSEGDTSPGIDSKGNSRANIIRSGIPGSGRGGAIYVNLEPGSGSGGSLLVRGSQSSGTTGGILSLSSGVGFATTASDDKIIPTSKERSGLNGMITLGGSGSNGKLSASTGRGGSIYSVIGSGDSGVGGTVRISAGSGGPGGPVIIESGVRGSTGSSGSIGVQTETAATSGLSGMVVMSTGMASKGNTGTIFLGSGGPASGRDGAVHVRVGSGNSGAGGKLVAGVGQSSGKTGGLLSLSSLLVSQPRGVVI
jgi:hypothetical protein